MTTTTTPTNTPDPTDVLAAATAYLATTGETPADYDNDPEAIVFVYLVHVAREYQLHIGGTPATSAHDMQGLIENLEMSA